jgi:hypothetical protein
MKNSKTGIAEIHKDRNYSVLERLYNAVHVSFACTVSFGHFPEAHSIMNFILLL